MATVKLIKNIPSVDAGSGTPLVPLWNGAPCEIAVPRKVMRPMSVAGAPLGSMYAPQRASRPAPPPDATLHANSGTDLGNGFTMGVALPPEIEAMLPPPMVKSPATPARVAPAVPSTMLVQTSVGPVPVAAPPPVATFVDEWVSGLVTVMDAGQPNSICKFNGVSDT